MLENELDGFLVVALEQAVAAPYTSLLLADAGARVIKVERPEGDFARAYDDGANGQSTIFAWLNRGKQSIALDLKNKDDARLLGTMLEKADIFLSNLAPGALARLGFDYQSLSAKNQGLISCAINGYGESGKAAHKKAYDFLVQGESGLCSVTGTQDQPVRIGIPIADLATGLTAFSAILRALIQRGRTGKGVELSISMFDVMADWMNMPLMGHRYMGGAPARYGLTHSFVAPYGAFKTGDDGLVLLSIQNNREFETFCADILDQAELARDPRFCDNPKRYSNREILSEIILQAFADKSTSRIVEMLDQARIANARLNSVAELSDHEFLKNAIAQIGDQKIELAALPVKTNMPANKNVPDLGEHNEKIISEFS